MICRFAALPEHRSNECPPCSPNTWMLDRERAEED